VGLKIGSLGEKAAVWIGWRELIWKMKILKGQDGVFVGDNVLIGVS